jgi:hypothetical protein
MATKRKSTKRKSTKRRTHKMGAVHHAPKRTYSRSKKVGAISQTGEILLGAVAGSFVTRVIVANLPKPTTTTSTDLRPYTGLVLGAAAEYFGKKNLLIKSMGIGAIVEGARDIVTDKYIPSLTGSKTSGLPYTTAHVGKNKMNKLMNRQMKGLRNSLVIGANSTSNGLAGVKPTNVFGYDGMF